MEWIDAVAALTAMRHCGGLVTTYAIETGIRRAIKHAYLICVHVVNDGKLIPVKYGIEVETLFEKAEWEGVVRHNAARKQRIINGY